MAKKELEREAEEWIKDHSGLIGSYTFVKYDYDSMQKSYLAGAEPREKRIAELEAQLESERDLSAIAYMQGAEKQKKKDEEQLTKAKELLKQWLSLCGFKVEKLSKDTEQFLSEVEK